MRNTSAKVVMAFDGYIYVALNIRRVSGNGIHLIPPPLLSDIRGDSYGFQRL